MQLQSSKPIKKTANKKAFTLIEILISIAIMVVIFTIGTAGYQDFTKRQVVVAAARDINGALRLAQQKALSGEKPAGCTKLQAYSFRTNAQAAIVNTPAPTGVQTVEVNGLEGKYYGDTTLTSLRMTRTDPDVRFDWGTGAPNATMGTNTFSVRWTGDIRVPRSGDYTFYTRTDDGVRLRIDGVLVINKWLIQPYTEHASDPIPLSVGQDYRVIMDYFEDTNTAQAGLLWSGPGVGKQFIPTDYLIAPSTASATPTSVPVSTAVATPLSGVTNYVIEALCTNSTTPIAVQTITVPSTVRISGFQPLSFRSVEGGTNIASGRTILITVTAPGTTHSQTITIEASGDIH